MKLSGLRLSASGLAGAIAVLGLVCGAGTAAGAGMYKWMDDQGVVHYTDRIPADSVSKGATVLDKQGRSVKKIDPAPTAEQRKAIEVEAERQRELRQGERRAGATRPGADPVVHQRSGDRRRPRARGLDDGGAADDGRARTSPT